MKIKWHLRPELLRVPLGVAAALCGGFLLSAGTVSGVSSPLAAALAGITPPLYSMSILLGSLICYGVTGAPVGMHFLLTALVLVTCLRILFHEQYQPHVLALMTTSCCLLGGVILQFVFYAGSGNLPLYIFESFLTGIAAYFLADGAANLRIHRRIVLHAGKTFTYALCYLLCITALCGLDTTYCNIGRIVGMSVTLLFARQLKHTGGTLAGALTACGVTLCDIRLGTPMLFLPVTGMMAGFLCAFPNPLYIAVYFVMQALSSAILDGSRGLVRVGVELALSCSLYATVCGMDMRKFLLLEETAAVHPKLRQERMLSGAFQTLQREADAVMHRLAVAPPEDGVSQIHGKLCTGCKNQNYCWGQRAPQTAAAIRELIHTHERGLVPEALDGCVRRTTLLALCSGQAGRSALGQMQRVHILQNRKVTLEHLQIMEELTSTIAAAKEQRVLAPQTDALRRILKQCASQGDAQVIRLRSGRYAAQILTTQEDFPIGSVRKLLSRYLGVTLCEALIDTESQGMHYCLYEEPPYELEFEMQSRNAPDYERCGDHADAFTDAAGDQYLILSDGMGSGSTASLASRIAVRTFRRMVQSGMRVPTAIRLVNSMLLTETGTENFATLDVFHFHCDSGEFSLYKSGAAATLFCHKGQVQRITSMSFPVGIVTDALPASRRAAAYAGDMVVMLSDGISEAQYPYLSQLLRQGAAPAEVVAYAQEKCAVFHGGTQRDDVTVIAARICSHFCTESTKAETHVPAPDMQQIPDSVNTM